jgi:hypothetical protein
MRKMERFASGRIESCEACRPWPPFEDCSLTKTLTPLPSQNSLPGADHRLLMPTFSILLFCVAGVLAVVLGLFTTPLSLTADSQGKVVRPSTGSPMCQKAAKIATFRRADREGCWHIGHKLVIVPLYPPVTTFSADVPSIPKIMHYRPS